MSRYNKGPAPGPPFGRGSKHSVVEPKSFPVVTDSLVTMFDDLTRNSKVLMEGAAEKCFLNFASSQELCRRKWESAQIEVLKLKEEILKCEGNLKKLEMQLGQARDLLANETTYRKRAETERDTLAEKWQLVRELITEGGGGNTINDATKIKFQKLEASLSSRRGTALFSPGQGGGVPLSPVNERDSSSGSILDVSDLSFDHTQGSMVRQSQGQEVNESKLRRSGNFFKRKSSGGVAQIVRQEKRRKSSGQSARGKSLEAVAARRSNDALRVAAYNERNIDEYITEDRNLEDYSPSAPLSPNRGMEPSVSSVTLTPSHASTTTLLPTTPYTPGGLGRLSSISKMIREHKFVQKNCYKTETCGPCGKRIKFSKVCYKCSECRAIAHPECRNAVPMPCVPVGSAQKTPSGSNNPGNILAHLVPLSHPMVPAIVVHCVNEIEQRGLEEIGLYRVPGAEREVRELRDKFQAGRGCPNLSQVDVHVLCGTVKDFFRNLREPLIPNSMWSQFTEAANNPDTTDGEAQLYQAVSELPPPNRDTLAFVMSHLQKVAASPSVKMNVSNLGKILSPTIIGYRSLDPRPEEILREVGILQNTMERLISLNSEYLATFLTTTEGKNMLEDNKFMSPLLNGQSFFRTPYLDVSMAPAVAKSGGMTPAVAQSGGMAGNPLNAKARRIFASPKILD